MHIVMRRHGQFLLSNYAGTRLHEFDHAPERLAFEFVYYIMSVYCKNIADTEF
jgi:hypothetical protein